MSNATHFIEQFRDIRKNDNRVMNGFIHPIHFLKSALDLTANSKDLKTVAVFKIKFKEKK